MPQSFESPPLRGWQLHLLAALLGVCSHLSHYIRSNRDPQSISIVLVHVLLLPVISITVTTTTSLSIASLLNSVAVWTSFHLGLVGSMVTYRLFFHPLCRIPGPLWAKISKIPILVIARRGKLHELHTEWARRYGQIVRIGQYFNTIGIAWCQINSIWEAPMKFWSPQ